MLTGGIALLLIAVITACCRAEYRRLEHRQRWELLAPLADLADPEQERVVCRCTWWNPEADRLLLVPCAGHLEEMVMAGEAQ